MPSHAYTLVGTHPHAHLPSHSSMLTCVCMHTRVRVHTRAADAVSATVAPALSHSFNSPWGRVSFMEANVWLFFCRELLTQFLSVSLLILTGKDFFCSLSLLWFRHRQQL